MWQKILVTISAFFAGLFGSNNTPVAILPTPTVIQEVESKFSGTTPTTAVTPLPTLKVPTSTPTIPPLRTISFGGFSYEDRNDDGLFNSDDPRVPYMQFYLYDTYAPNTQISTVFSDANGGFSGSIAVRKKLLLKPTSYNNYKPKSGNQEVSTSTSTLQFGFRTVSAPEVNQSGILEGDVFQDTNQNRSRDNGETSVYFYKLYLVNESGNYYNTVENAQTTDAGGHFKFVNLPTGHTYTLRLSNPTGDYNIPQTEFNYSLTATQTQYTNIQIPVFKN